MELISTKLAPVNRPASLQRTWVKGYCEERDKLRISSSPELCLLFMFLILRRESWRRRTGGDNSGLIINHQFAIVRVTPWPGINITISHNGL